MLRRCLTSGSESRGGRRAPLRLGLLARVVMVMAAFSLGSASPAHAHWTRVGTFANAPVQSAPNAYIWGREAFSTSHAFFISVYLQRRACGFWGCSWQEKILLDAATVGGHDLSRGGRKALDAGCHDYRTTTVVGVRHAWDTGYASYNSPTRRMCR